MIADRRRTYTAEFKREAVHLITERGYMVAEAARNLGLNPPMLRRWKRELTEYEYAAFPGNGRVVPAQEERHRLQEENKRLRMERDILKKALGFFANESRCDRPSSSNTRKAGRLRSCARC